MERRRKTDTKGAKVKTIFTYITFAVFIVGTVVAALTLKFETKDNALKCHTELKEDIVKVEKDVIKIDVQLENIFRATQEIKQALK